MHTINCSTELLLADPAGCFSNLILPIHAAFDAVVMVAKGTAENSRQLLLALLGGRLGRRLPLPHLTDRRRGAASEGVWRGGGSKNTQEC
jgi:hypothetical protein